MMNRAIQKVTLCFFQIELGFFLGGGGGWLGFAFPLVHSKRVSLLVPVRWWVKSERNNHSMYLACPLHNSKPKTKTKAKTKEEVSEVELTSSSRVATN